MVKTPGHSGSCRTCRRRKKGCDKRRPSCRGCVRSGLVCPGYETDIIFVYNGAGGNAESKSIYSKADLVAASSGSDVPLKMQKQKQQQQRQRQQDVAVVLHESLAVSSRQQKVTGLFWSAYLPNGRSFSSQAAALSIGGWTSHVEDLCSSEVSLKLAVLALSSSVLGLECNDKQLRIKGLQLYGNATIELAAALQDPERALGDGVLVATRLLQFFEIAMPPADTAIEIKASPGITAVAEKETTESPQIDAWKAHQDGVAALFSARGPAAMQQPVAHQLFVDFRLDALISAIVYRKAAPLNHHHWRSLPWGKGQIKSPKDELYDIISYLPGLLEELDELRAADPRASLHEIGHRQHQLDLLDRCHLQDEALGRWVEMNGASLPTLTLAAPGLPLPPPQNDCDLSELHISCLYWASLMLLRSTASAVLRMHKVDCIPETGGQSCCQQLCDHHLPLSMQAWAAECWRFDPRPLLVSMARAAPLFYAPGMGSLAGAAGFFPLGLALRTLAAIDPPGLRSQESLMLRDLLKMPYMGSTVGRFLTNLQQRSPSRAMRNVQGFEGIVLRARAWFHGASAQVQMG